MHWFIWELLILFHWSMCLFLCPYYNGHTFWLLFLLQCVWCWSLHQVQFDIGAQLLSLEVPFDMYIPSGNRTCSLFWGFFFFFLVNAWHSGSISQKWNYNQPCPRPKSFSGSLAKAQFLVSVDALWPSEILQLDSSESIIAVPLYYRVFVAVFKVLLEGYYSKHRASLIAQLEKNAPAMQEILVQFLGLEDLLEKE